MDTSCTFCAEFSPNPSGEFSERYAELLPSRSIYDDGIFRSFPTIGQIRLGHMLLAPSQHFDNFSQLLSGRKREFAKACNAVRLMASTFGHVSTFEHGAGKLYGGGCGIYHAHMHFVPLPKPLTAEDLGLSVEAYYPDLASALESVLNHKEYIVGHDPLGTAWVLKGASFGSQFMRKRIIETLHLDAPLNWRAVSRIEPQMFTAMNILRLSFKTHLATDGGHGRTI